MNRPPESHAIHVPEHVMKKCCEKILEHIKSLERRENDEKSKRSSGSGPASGRV